MKKNKTKTSLLTNLKVKSVQHILHQKNFKPVLNILERRMKLQNLKKPFLHKQDKSKPKVTSNHIGIDKLRIQDQLRKKLEARKKQVDMIDEGRRMIHHLDNFCSFGD